MGNIEIPQKLKIFEYGITNDEYEIINPVFSSDGTILAVPNNNQIGLWNLISGQKEKTLSGNANGIRHISLEKDGKSLATSNNNSTLVWLLDSTKSPNFFEGYQKYLSPREIGSHQKYLITSNQGFSLWDITTGKRLNDLSNSIAEHLKGEGLTNVKFSPDEKKILLRKGENLKLWDINKGKIVWQTSISSGIRSVEFSEDGKILEGTESSGNYILNNISTGETFNIEEADYLSQLKIIDDGKTFFLCRETEIEGNKCEVWEIKDNKLLKKYSIDGKSHFSQDGKFFAIETSPNREQQVVEIRETSTNKLVKTLSGDVNLYHLFLSPNGKYLANLLSELTVWEVGIGKILWQYPTESDILDFSADGKVLAINNEDLSKVDLLEVATGKLLGTLRGHSSSVRYLTFSPVDKNLLATGTVMQIKLWDCQSLKEISTFEWANVNTGFVALDFSKDGKTLGAIYDSRIKLWDVEKGKSLTDKENEYNAIFSKGKWLQFFDLKSSIWGDYKEKNIKTTIDVASGKIIKQSEVFGVPEKEKDLKINGIPIEIKLNDYLVLLCQIKTDCQRRQKSVINKGYEITSW